MKALRFPAVLAIAPFCCAAGALLYSFPRVSWTHVIPGQHVMTSLTSRSCLTTSILFDPLHRMEPAIAYKKQHPSENYSAVATLDVPKPTLQARISGIHDARGHRTICKLAIVQEQALVSSINAYTERGTFLPQNMCNSLLHGSVGTNLVSIGQQPSFGAM